MKLSLNGSGISILTALVSGVAASTVHAQSLSNTEIYERCYIRMVRAVPKANDARLAQVKAGTLKPEAACVQLFELATIGTSGVLNNRTSAESKRLLKTFHDLHQSWFSIRLNSTNNTANYVLRDLEEPALYFTRAAFQTGVQFKTVVTHPQGLAGVRDPAVAVSDFEGQKNYAYPSYAEVSDKENFSFSYNSYVFIPAMPAVIAPAEPAVPGVPAQGGRPAVAPIPAKPERVIKAATPARYTTSVQPMSVTQIAEVGELVGVRSSASVKLPSFIPVGGINNSTFPADLKSSVESTRQNFEVNTHFGGGVIGSQTFLVNNTNLTIGELPNGVGAINRRITAKVFEDLLCHQLPTLTANDVKSEVVANSPYTFQRSVSCMQCHSSMDPAAYGLRNFVFFRTSALPNTDGQKVGTPIDAYFRLAPVANAKTFAVTPGVGRLHYRELITKTKRQSQFSTLGEMGQQIADGYDLYTCAAKRYYQFFTGINVGLDSPATSDTDKYHQEVVLNLGKNLRTSQSVKKLIQEIFQSAAFKERDYNPKVGK